jgi:hypothetical protein
MRKAPTVGLVFLGYAVRRERTRRPNLASETFAKHQHPFAVHGEEDYFAAAYLFATSSQFTTLQNAAM